MQINIRKIRQLHQLLCLSLWEYTALIPAFNDILFLPMNMETLINTKKLKMKTQLSTAMKMNEIDGHMENVFFSMS